MLRHIQLNFLLQYASLILLILSILIAVNYSASPEVISSKQYHLIEDQKVHYFKTELVLHDLFQGNNIDLEKFTVLKTFLDNHNIDLTILIPDRNRTLQDIYKISDALEALGLSSDSFSVISVNSQTSVVNPNFEGVEATKVEIAENSALLKLSWSQL